MKTTHVKPTGHVSEAGIGPVTATKLPNVLQRLSDLQEASGALRQLNRGGTVSNHIDHNDIHTDHTDNHRDRP